MCGADLLTQTLWRDPWRHAVVIKKVDVTSDTSVLQTKNAPTLTGLRPDLDISSWPLGVTLLIK